MATAQVETIDKEELLKKIEEGSVQVVNVLDPEWYKLGIIKGSKKLAAKGFKVRAYEGGIKEWKEAGLPIEKAKSSKGSEGSCCGGTCS